MNQCTACQDSYRPCWGVREAGRRHAANGRRSPGSSGSADPGRQSRIPSSLGLDHPGAAGGGVAACPHARSKLAELDRTARVSYRLLGYATLSVLIRGFSDRDRSAGRRDVRT